MVSKKKIYIGILIICLSLTFILANILVAPPSFTFNEDTNTRLNITINNTNIGQNSNITEVNITLPLGFTFAYNSNWSTISSTFSNTSDTLSWVNTSRFLINGTYNMSVWFNVTASIAGYFNITIASVNGSGAYYSNISVNVNDTTYPLVSFVTPVTYANVSGLYVINISVTEDTPSKIYFNITNSSGTQNGTLTPSRIGTSSYWNATWNTSKFNEGTYNISVWVNDSNNQINSSIYVYSVLVDNTAPAISAFSCSPSSVYNNNVETCSCTATDSGSGISSTVYTANPSTTTLGTFTETCTVTDFAGNIATTTTTYTVTTRSGGSTSSTSTSTWTNTYTTTNEQFSEGYTKGLEANERVKVVVGNDNHYVGIKSMSSDSASIVVTSEPVEITLNVGEEAKLDVDNDKVYDIYVVLNSISSGKAEITIKKISETVPKGEESVKTTGEITTPKEETSTENNSANKNYSWILIATIIIALIVIGIGYKAKKKR